MQRRAAASERTKPPTGRLKQDQNQVRTVHLDMTERRTSRPRPPAGRTVTLDSDRWQHDSEQVHRRPCPASSSIPPPDYQEGDEDEDLIKPKKLMNPVKASRSHQELHRELLSSCRRGGSTAETKPELQRVLESRRRNQLIRQRKQEEEARRKISPLEAELLKRHRKLAELEKQQEQQNQENLRDPEFVKVRKNLRATALHPGEKEAPRLQLGTD